MSAEEKTGSVPQESELVYDWNTVEERPRPAVVQFDDETLRDGIQSPSARDPNIDEKLRLLHLMADLRIDAVNLGLPCSSERQRSDEKRMA